MSEQKRRFLDRTAQPAPLRGSPTVIGADTVFIGNLRGKGQFVISGEVHGDGELQGTLHLAASASWHGNIRAHQASIAGNVEGALDVTDQLEIGCTAVIRGRVRARTIAIAKGAVVDGEIQVTSDVPIVQFEEKRGE
jgi:cytoskeletal protein CcmA (bactofilin family)